ncbi:hypothetical protein MG290_05435 [Flavobacterium sp. CBA20B-1]|uniref:hypothetical protein n=1 Tax=unclassified Flavobacterium TaxID=196869 RepID=UPI002225335D|nr:MULTISPECIES: hypothetical protein [unclassified Flavobacterium]WCM43114.1 hypothetical protein MG290_05435 [Flavobacterium sp. CBA20B-1]
MKNIYLIFISFIFLSCSNRNERVLSSIEDFEKNIGNWNDLTEDILKDEIVNQKLETLIKVTDLNQSIYNRLHKENVIYIIVTNNLNCQKVEYQKKWSTSVGTQYLEWTSCDSIKTQKGYYEDLNPIHVFGIGNKWLTWIDLDPI